MISLKFRHIWFWGLSNSQWSEIESFASTRNCGLSMILTVLNSHVSIIYHHITTAACNAEMFKLPLVGSFTRLISSRDDVLQPSHKKQFFEAKWTKRRLRRRVTGTRKMIKMQVMKISWTFSTFLLCCLWASLINISFCVLQLLRENERRNFLGL